MQITMLVQMWLYDICFIVTVYYGRFHFPLGQSGRNSKVGLVSDDNESVVLALS